MHWDFDLGFLNFVMSTTFTYGRVLTYALEYFMNQFSTLSLNVVVKWAIFMSSSMTCFTLHTTSHRNQCCSGSSNPDPMKTDSFMSSSILFLLGGCVFCTGGWPWPLGEVWLVTRGLTKNFYGVGGIKPLYFLVLLGELSLGSLLWLLRCSKWSPWSTLYLFPLLKLWESSDSYSLCIYSQFSFFT